ncbi:MAG: UDP-N-acetylglucosamine 2-epimerase (hydrolyzing) [Bacteroidetes bacterium]|nr:UDP-N-acetylglucosamine 2-epimerase (hydrolyzing) [Bacteroidota bacterium]
MKICIATGTRAEYGLLKPLMDEIRAQPGWELQLLVTGAHLSPEFGMTLRQIEQDQMPIAAQVEMLLSSDSPEGIVKSMGLGMIGFSSALQQISPDLLIILGDRYEMLAVAAAALIYKIPIAHIHGGEITEGAYDDAIRHSISKMSMLHFASTEAYRRRIIQLGEAPERVFNVGALAMDNIKNLPVLSREALEADLGISLAKDLLLVTFHPVTLDTENSGVQFQELLHALDHFEDCSILFTKANADTDGRIINQMIDAYAQKHPGRVFAFTSLGQLRYLSALKCASAVVGNSSSGLLEAPACKVPTVNIGDRQKGRISADSVLNCGVSSPEIVAAIQRARSKKFLESIQHMENPYGGGNTAKQIVAQLASYSGNRSIQKHFFDIPQIAR